MKSYRQNKMVKNNIKRNTTYKGESIEKKLQRITQNNEPITDGAPLIYQDRKDGVQPEYDVRTDRFEVAIDAMDKVTKTHKARRDERIGEKAKKGMEKEAKDAKTTENGGAEPSQGTDGPKA